MFSKYPGCSRKNVTDGEPRLDFAARFLVLAPPRLTLWFSHTGFRPWRPFVYFSPFTPPSCASLYLLTFTPITRVQSSRSMCIFSESLRLSISMPGASTVFRFAFNCQLSRRGAGGVNLLPRFARGRLVGRPMIGLFTSGTMMFWVRHNKSSRMELIHTNVMLLAT